MSIDPSQPPSAPPAPRVTGQYQHTYEEFAEAIAAIQKQAIKRPFATTRGRGVLGWILLLGLAVSLFVMLRRQSSVTGPITSPSSPAPSAPNPLAEPMQILLPLLPWLILFGFVWFFVHRGMRGRHRAVWDKQPLLHRPRTLEADDDGITFTDPFAYHRLSWPHYLKWSETPRLFLLFTSAHSAEFIPKSAFANAAALATFRDLLTRHVGSAGSAFPVITR